MSSLEARSRALPFSFLHSTRLTLAAALTTLRLVLRSATLQRFVPALILFVAIAACRGQIIITGPPPTLTIPSGPFTTDQYTPVVVQLPARDSWGVGANYTSITASVGTVELQGYTLTYYPDTNLFFQGATINVQGSDNSLSYAGVSFPYGGNITILPVLPVISFTTSPGITFPGTEARVVLVSNSEPVLISFDGTGTMGTNSLPVSETWYEGTNCILASGQSGSVWESIGSHTITMTATDGVSTNTGSQTIEILTPDGAVVDMENYVAQSSLSEKSSRDLQRMLSKAGKWAYEGKQRRAYIELFDLQKKLQSRHNPVSPDISTNLVTGAQEIMDNL